MSYLDRDKLGLYRDYADGPAPPRMGADTLLGESVYNSDGDYLGELKEIVLDMRSGAVAYAVLAVSGAQGEEKLFALPWQSLELDSINHRFLLEMGKDYLAQAPGLEPDHWPAMASSGWNNEVDTYYDPPAHSDIRAGAER